MTKYSIICLYFCVCFSAQAQYINGRVLDSKSHEPIVFANVYFNGTIKGTTTDNNGNFSLKEIPNQHLPFTISFVGFLSSQITKYDTNNVLTIFLRPKTFDLPVVEIKSKKTNRKRKERIFIREFLGSSDKVKYCIIQNLNDIKLVYSKDKSTLYAFTKKPILINNTYLGYNIAYYLDHFYFRRDTVFFQGAYRFIEKPFKNFETIKQIKKHRELVYFGSKMHFIRSLYANKLKSEGYSVRGNKHYKLPYDSIMTHKNSHYINIKDHIRISYLGIEESRLYQLKDSIYITENGFSYPYGILWTGNMGGQRLCDLLPFEYKPE